MNVTAVAVDVLQVPVEHAYVAAGRRVEGEWHVLARVTTAEGIEDIGYIVALRQDLVRAVAQATGELGTQLIGAHVLEVEASWAHLTSVGNWIGPGGLLRIAIALLDIACWTRQEKSWASRCIV